MCRSAILDTRPRPLIPASREYSLEEDPAVSALGGAAADFCRHVRRLCRHVSGGLSPAARGILYSIMSALCVALVMAILKSWIWTLVALGAALALLIVSWVLSHTIW
jgi:Flp pilus assembly protein TadB